MMARLSGFLSTLLACTSLLLCAPCQAEDSQYPTRPIQLVVTFPPGGSADYVARILAQRMSAALGQQVVVLNRGGAAGSVGAQSVANAQPDGYTLVLTSVGALVINPALAKEHLYDTRRDFVPISPVANVYEAIMASKASGFHSLAQLVEQAKANPGKISYGSTGIGSLPHLAGELLKLEAGIDLVHVPYTGGATAMSDLLAGRIEVMIADLPAYLPLIASGSVVALCVDSAERAAVLPSVPTAPEAGFPALVADNWFGLLAPAGTPEFIIKILNKVVVAALSEPKVKADFERAGAAAVPKSPDDFRSYITAEQTRWGEVIKRAKITTE
jgi:tripartite-type tricarboxylate transporter receptor subunit TctC